MKTRKTITKHSTGRNNIALKQTKLNRAMKNAKPVYNEYFSASRKSASLKQNYNKKQRATANAYARVVHAQTKK